MAAYEVWLKGFAADADDPISELMSMFSLTEERARKLAGAVPVAVKKNTTRETAEKFVQRLEAIGAEVEIRTAGPMSEQLPQRPRAARSVAPSRSRTGRGLGRLPSSPDMPAFEEPEPGSLPRRRSSSSSMEAISARPPGPRRRHSNRGMAAVTEDGPPRRGAAALPLPDLGGDQPERPREDDDGIAVPFGEDAAPARRQQATAALGSPVASRPPQRAAVVGRHRSTPPSASEQPRRRRNTGELPKAGPAPMSGAPPAASRPPPAIPAAPLPMSPISDVPPAMSSAAPSATTSAAPPPPIASVAPPLGVETTARPATTSDYAPPAGAVLVGVIIIAWRVMVEESIFQGQAGWLFGVWLEAAALASILAGGLRLLAVRDERGGESFLGSNGRYVAAMIPLAALVNWGISSTQSRALDGTLDARIEVLNKIADACERTAKDEDSCAECCETGMEFEDVCECVVPFHCTEGDEDARACKECCMKLSDDVPSYRHVHNQGCVCNADSSFFR